MLREHGFSALQRSLLRFEIDRGLMSAASDLDGVAWVVFTSAEAVHAMSATRRAGGWIWPAGLRAACVGPATAKAAADAGLDVGVMPRHYDGASLTASLLAETDVRGSRFFWPRAEAANTGLADMLRAAGGEVHDVVAYRAVPHACGGLRLQRDMAADRIEAVLFFSPSAVDAYMDMVGRTDAVVGVLGGSTGARARARGLPVHVQPATHTITALAGALRDYAKRERRTESE